MKKYKEMSVEQFRKQYPDYFNFLDLDLRMMIIVDPDYIVRMDKDKEGQDRIEIGYVTDNWTIK